MEKFGKEALKEHEWKENFMIDTLVYFTFFIIRYDLCTWVTGRLEEIGGIKFHESAKKDAQFKTRKIVFVVVQHPNYIISY